MTTLVILTDAYAPIDTAAADVLITPADNAPFMMELYMAGSKVPAATDQGHKIRQPILLPKGVGAYVKGGGAIHVSPMLAK